MQFLEALQKEQKVVYNIRNSRTNYKIFKCQHDKPNHKPVSPSKMRREPKTNQIKGHDTCPSFFSMNKKDGVVVVKFCLFHAHDCHKQFLNLSPDIKNEIEVKLRLGIESKEVLKQVKDEFPEYLVTIQDIWNIKNLKLIGNISLNSNDKLSCELMAVEHGNEIKLLKYQQDDIQIFIQSKFQKDIVKSITHFGLDSTHCTTRYGFYLTTLHAIPKNEQGMPVAHMISSNEKQETIESFLSEVKSLFSTKQITLITDDYPPYSNAWQKILGNHAHVQCLWHLNKNWRKNLISNFITGNKFILIPGVQERFLRDLNF